MIIDDNDMFGAYLWRANIGDLKNNDNHVTTSMHSVFVVWMHKVGIMPLYDVKMALLNFYIELFLMSKHCKIM
jgi:hypothetical protein